MLDRQAEAAELIAEVALLTPDLTPATMAEIERVKGRLLARTGHPAEALEHLDRALRILDVVPHALLKLDLQRDRERLLADLPHPPAAAGATAAAAPLALQGAVRLLDSAGNPALLGREIVALAAAVPWIRACACLETHAGGVDVGACHGWTAEAARSAASTPRLTQLSLGSWRGRTLSVVIEPQDDPQARYGVAALRTLVEAAVTLERGRQEEKRRSALWSFDPPDGSAAGIFLSNATLEILSIAQKVAPTDLPVLITGETGTGKELLARILHQHSGRERKPFLPFNCTAMPRELVESQLFGHRRGAFTGAQESFQGVIRAAAGGTIFLDEIGELGPEVQPKLLRFLETGEIHPLGEPKPIAVDVRIVAATNVDLDGLVASGRFREDLYYRLNVVRLTIPPLRERREEIPPLLHHFIAKSCGEVGKAPLRIADEALEYLVLFSWPGNVRQLANEIRRLVALAESGTRIEPAHLSPEIRASRRTLPAGPAGTADEVTVRIDQPLAAAVEQIERAMLQRALRQAGGNLEAAAQALGISRKGLYLKRHRLGLGPLAPAPERTEGARLPAEE